MALADRRTDPPGAGTSLNASPETALDSSPLSAAPGVGAPARSLAFDDAGLARDLFGPEGDHLRRVAGLTRTRISSRGTEATLVGDPDDVELAARLLTELYGLLKSGRPVYGRDIRHAYNVLARDAEADLKHVFAKDVFVASPKKTITPKTAQQASYVAAIRATEMVFGIGPAGTGKTYLAVAMAVAALTSGQVKRIILTRPAVEAGERLGFLPGDLVEKINPYLRPLYDALHDLLDPRKVLELLETNVIEIAPLAFMRGRTLNDAFIILDEAQNTTPEQMKMFLTRLGFNSRAVITGDATQVDLPRGSRSGLVEASRILAEVEGVAVVRFSETDVVRNDLVARIVKAYETAEAQAAASGAKPHPDPERRAR